MQIVIDIPDKEYEVILNNNYVAVCACSYLLSEAIKNGTQLPKGHGRIIDETKISKCEQVGLIIKDGNITRCFTTDAPTIIEADRSERSDKE